MIGRISRPAFTDPAADRLRPLLGFCHLEGSDQPFETQLQTAWVSFGKQMWVAFAGPEGGSTELVNNRSRSLSSRWIARSVMANRAKRSALDEGSTVPVASKKRLAAPTR